MQPKVKHETSLDKVRPRKGPGRSKSDQAPAGGTVQDIPGASQAGFSSGVNRRRDRRHRHRTGLPHNPLTVPVLDLDGEPVMPTCASRARRWVKARKATPFWLNGVWCIRLKFERSRQEKQAVVVGIDPGSKREAYTVASVVHTYRNVLCDAVDWVKDAVATRRVRRRNRRHRNTPYRSNRKNRSRGGLPPRTKARWQRKLRVVDQLRRMYPITGYAVEDVAAKTKEGTHRWNQSLSPLECGKRWMYGELRRLGDLTIRAGHETAELRKAFGAVKTPGKRVLRFDAHHVDSWVLAKDKRGVRECRPENLRLGHCRPLQFRRRALHVQNPAKGGIRRSHGGTLSAGFKRGSLVKHPRHGLCTVGGTMDGRVSLHHLSGKRLCQNAKPADLQLLKRASLIFQRVYATKTP